MITRKPSTENVHREDKWCNFACTLGCDSYMAADYNSDMYPFLDEAACDEECYGMGTGEGQTDEEVVQGFCNNHPNNPVCNIELNANTLEWVKTIICAIYPDLGFCGNASPSGCSGTKVQCPKGGTWGCNNVSECDSIIPQDEVPKLDAPTNWGMIAAIGGGVILLGLVAILVLKKK